MYFILVRLLLLNIKADLKIVWFSLKSKFSLQFSMFISIVELKQYDNLKQLTQTWIILLRNSFYHD